MASGKYASGRYASSRWRYFFLLAALCFLIFLTACSENRVVLEGPDVIYADAFVPGATGNWLVEGDDAGRTAVLNEKLVITVDEPNLLQYTTLNEPIFADFVLEVDVTQLTGDLESSYGILFRMQNPGQFYRFDITGNGLYVVERHNGDGTWTRFLDDWEESPHIKQGLAVTNRLKVMAQGPVLSFYANDQLLQQFNDASYAAGQIALDAGTFGRAGLEVAFDNVVVRSP